MRTLSLGLVDSLVSDSLMDPDFPYEHEHGGRRTPTWDAHYVCFEHRAQVTASVGEHCGI
jgi:hypothetical protein